MLQSLLLALIIPVHGTVLGNGANGTTVVRLDAATDMVPAITRAFTIDPRLHVPTGTGLDAYLDRSRSIWRLYDAHVAARFEPGLPERGTIVPIDYGSSLPNVALVDQTGRFVDIGTDFPGKVVVVSFIFTRCPDRNECPAVSGKFAALQQRLDARRFHLVEISLDPGYDSPAVLKQYASQFGARPQAWSILTGQQHEVQRLLDRFGISSLRVSDERFLHNDKVFVTSPDGRVADIVLTTGFAPEALAAEAQHLAGIGSNPFERWKLALVASAIALCGGSQFAGVVLLETVTFLIIAVVSFITLGWVARKIWRRA